MARMNLTQPVEDYLKCIYELGAGTERVSTNQLADCLGVTPASVTGMLKKLAENDPALVDYQKHHGAVLTEVGKKAALEIVRHHRLLEMFLHQVLGFDWDEVHEEADRLEHVISEAFEERIARVMGEPKLDPHGDPIPTRDFQMPKMSGQPLSDLRPRQAGVVQRVTDESPELLRYLSQIGLVPMSRLEILAYSPLDENISLQVEGYPVPVVLGPGITREIYVEVDRRK
jgi:DtxR family transcriptional regulator, Mn-dependent transcriptional regulator